MPAGRVLDARRIMYCLPQVVQTAALQQYPQLAAVVGDAGTEAFSSEVENEANAYFQRAYAGGLGKTGLWSTSAQANEPSNED